MVTTPVNPKSLADLVAESNLTQTQIAERMAEAQPPARVTRERVSQIIKSGCGANKTLRAFASAIGQPLNIVMDAEAVTTSAPTNT